MSWLFSGSQVSEQPVEARVHIRVLEDADNFGFRSVTLREPHWSCSIGRASQTEPDLNPAADNAWFSSRVISRKHAVLRANPKTKEVSIEDVGSMHGTFLDGRQLTKSTPQALKQVSKITFGTQVVRGSEAYHPLQVKVAFEWLTKGDGDTLKTLHPGSGTYTTAIEIEDDEDAATDNPNLDVALDSVQEVDVDVFETSRTFRVPEDDSSSIASMDEESVEDHPTSPSDPTDVSDHEAKNEEISDEATTPLSLSDLPDEDYLSSDDDDLFTGELDNVHELENDHVNNDTGASKPVQSTHILRDPSPSDAAMAKSTPQKKLEKRDPQALTSKSCSNLSTGIPSLGEDFMDHYTGFERPYDSIPAQPLTYTYPISPSLLPFNTSNLQAASSDLPGFAEFARTSLVDLATSDPAVMKGKPPSDGHDKLKRKADQISVDAPELLSVNSFFESKYSTAPTLPEFCDQTNSESQRNISSSPSSNNRHIYDAKSNVNNVGTESDTGEGQSMAIRCEIVDVSDDEAIQPPRKKIKTGRGPMPPQKTRHGFAKYAATALAGVAIGAVGTVFGLASLPTDFFA